MNLQLHVISSSGDCYIKIYSNVAYIYFGPQRLGPHRLWGLHLCKLVYLHITRIFHANYNCKKSLKILKG